MKQFATRHRLLLFFLLAFGISWGVPGLAMLAASLTGAFEVSLEMTSPLTYAAIWAPAIAAFITIGVQDGWQGMAAYARRCVRLTGHWGWYAGVFFGIPLLIFISGWLSETAGMPAIALPAGPWLGAFLLENLRRGSLGPFEELGWRGLALPLLQQRLPGWRATLLLGVVWALWHFPALVMDSLMTGVLAGSLPVVLLRFTLYTLAVSFIMTVIFNGSRGSIPLMFLFHLLTNLHYPWELEAGINLFQSGLTVLAALTLAWVFGRRYLGRQNLVTQ